MIQLLRDRRKQGSTPGNRPTDAMTGQPVDLHPHIHDRASLQAALRASAAMPLLAGPPVEIDGTPYVDAGVSEGTPVRTALAQGATHIVAFRTRPPVGSVSIGRTERRPDPLKAAVETGRRTALDALSGSLEVSV